MIRSLAAKYAGPLLQSIFGENFDYPAVRRRRKELMAQQLKKTGIEKKPFVDEALEALKAMGIKTAVATATDMQRAGSYLKQIGIYDKFDRSSVRTWWKTESLSQIFMSMPAARSKKRRKTALLWRIRPMGCFLRHGRDCKP